MAIITYVPYIPSHLTGKEQYVERKMTAHYKVYMVGLRSAVSCAKTAEPNEMLFGLRTRVGPRKHLLGGKWECTPAPLCEYHWTVYVPRQCGMLSNYFDHLLFFLLGYIAVLYVHRCGLMLQTE